MSIGRINFRAWCLAFFLIAAGAVAAPVAVTRAQTFSPYSDFQAMSLADLATLQVKLTDVGGDYGGHLIATVLFGAPGHPPNGGLFLPFRRRGQTYLGDDFSRYTFTASEEELKALIDSLALLPRVTDGHVDPRGTVSFSLLESAPDTTRAFEVIVGPSDGAELFGAMLAALKHNRAAVYALRSFGCVKWMLPRTPPTIVQDRVEVVSSGLRADRLHPTEFVGTVRISNISGAVIPAPLILVVSVVADLFDRDGMTCNTEPPRHPFINLITSGGFAPGATVEQVVRLRNPGGGKLNAGFKVYAGAGTP